ncbi:MAG: PDZ domain-containing protein, partial [Planctomycetota bacterium]
MAAGGVRSAPAQQGAINGTSSGAQPVAVKSNNAEASSRPLQERIAAWIDQLDSDRFSVRELATQRLRAAEYDAVEAVAAAAASDESLEASTRASGILLAWSDSTDRRLALESLYRLAELDNHPTVSRMASDLIASVREYAAAEQIEQLGGHVVYDQSPGAVGPARGPLQVIIGPEWQGGADGLRHVAAIKHATRVSMYCSPLADAAVPHLLELGDLRRIEFYGSEVSDESVAILKERLPRLVDVDVRSGALLGIHGTLSVAGGRGGALVVQVQPGSAAHKAGIRPNDLITGIDQ